MPDLRRKGPTRLLLAAPCVAASCVAAIVGTQAVSAHDAGATSPGDASSCTAPATTATSGASFSADETLCRTYFDQGIVDERKFHVTVSDTKGLRDGQVITVSWTGAHPTGGVISEEQLA